MKDDGFTFAGRANDIITMAILFERYFTIAEIMQDYDIQIATAYRTLHFIKKIQYLDCRRNEKKQFVINIKNIVDEQKKIKIIQALKNR